MGTVSMELVLLDQAWPIATLKMMSWGDSAYDEID